MTLQVRISPARLVAVVEQVLRSAGLPLVAGACLVVAAAGILGLRTLPTRAAIAALDGRLQQQVAAARALPAPAKAAKAQALPLRDQAPQVVERIMREAVAAEVDLASAKYEFVAARDGMLARYAMTFPVHASYPKLRRFIDKVLAGEPSVAIESLRIERKSIGVKTVDAELRLSLFLGEGQ
ncbi:MAG: hypothetical protein RLZZ393_1904 [Pseudomonadota bacterium]|jgi:hypothetical protein